MIASFGGITFKGGITSDAISVSDYGNTMSLDTETQAQVGGKPATTIKGAGLEQLTFALELSSYYGANPQRTINTLRELLLAGVPYPFVMGGQPVGSNKWLLVGVAVSDTLLSGKGEIRQASVTLTLQEHVKDAAKDVATAGAPAGIAVNDAYKVQTPPADIKAALKRDNPLALNTILSTVTSRTP